MTNSNVNSIFILFGGDEYYPLGGLRDYIGQTGTFEDSFNLMESHYSNKDDCGNWYQIVEFCDGAFVSICYYREARGDNPKLYLFSYEENDEEYKMVNPLSFMKENIVPEFKHKGAHEK
jgi:hypothetical protein